MGRLHDHHIVKNMFQASAVFIGVDNISQVHFSQLAMEHRLLRKDFDVISVIMHPRHRGSCIETEIESRVAQKVKYRVEANGRAVSAYCLNSSHVIILTQHYENTYWLGCA